MNFRWSNIYVLQFLVVLNVNGLKLVPADRTVIKQNGTTRTISRYYLLPHENDKDNPSLTNDAGFSKFLREFDRNDKKKAQPGKKKVVDRYRIYIRRKLKKNVNKDVSKSGDANTPNKTGVAVNTSTSAEHVETTTPEPIKPRTYGTPIAPDSATNPDDEYIIQKNQVEVTAAFPKLVLGQKPSQTRESSENLLDLKDPHEILKAAAEAQAQKKLASLQSKGAPGGVVIQSEPKGGEDKENTATEETLKLKRPIETLSQAEINELYAQLYGKYVPVQIKPDDKEFEPKVIGVVQETVKQIPDKFKEDAAFKLLSALHNGPEKFTDQAVTETNMVQYNPSEGKEFTDKSVETTYEETQNSQPLPPSLIIDSYDTTSPSPVKPKEVQQLTITSKQNSNKVKPRNPLESYFLKFGIQNHDQLFNDQPVTVKITTTSSTTPSNEVLDQLPTTEQTLTAESPPILTYQSNVENTETQKNPPKLGFNQGTVEHSKTLLNHPLLGYKGNIDFSNTMNNPTLISYNHAGIDHTEPPILGYSKGSIKFPAGFKGGIDYTQTIKKPIGLGYNQGSIEYSDAMKKPPVGYGLGGIEYSQSFKHPPGFGHSQGGIDYSQTINNPENLGYNQGSIEYTGNMNSASGDYQATTESQHSRTPFKVPYNSASAEYLDTLKNPSQQGVKQIETKYAQAKVPPALGYNLAAADYSKTSRSPNSMINTPTPLDDEDVEYKFNTEYILPSTENAESSSINGDYNTTDENELRGGIGDEWTTLYQEIGTEDESQSKKPQIEIGSNQIVQIGGGSQIVNYPSQGNIDLASMCPECFKRIQAELVHNIETGTGGADGGASSILQLFKDSSLFSQLQTIAQQQQSGQGSAGSSSYSSASLSYPSASASLSASASASASASINTQGIIELIQSLDAQNQQQQLPIAPDKDQSLVKILEVVLKDTEGDSSTTFKDTSTKLFTIANLRKVLEALERRRQTQPVTDKETANLHMIIKLIFEMAMKQTPVTNGNGGDTGALWFKRLTSFMANPLMKYVFNLVRQTWLQEIMVQLYNNNYNLNVIRNPRWAAYLGAWRLPVKLVKYMNANYEYYDQNEYAVDYDNHGDYVQEVVAINPQSDAGVILNFLRNYLVHAQYYEQNGSVDFYRKQTEIFSRIAAYLRQRGYAVRIIQRLIRKLYAVLNANRALVTVARPACINRH